MGKIKQEYTCSLILINDLIGGKWKQRILWHIISGDNRFSLLQKGIPDITHKMLITQLRELEESGLIIRTDFEEVPPRVEYAIAPQYNEMIPILQSLCNFANQYACNHHITLSN